MSAGIVIENRELRKILPAAGKLGPVLWFRNAVIMENYINCYEGST